MGSGYFKNFKEPLGFLRELAKRGGFMWIFDLKKMRTMIIHIMVRYLIFLIIMISRGSIVGIL